MRTCLTFRGTREQTGAEAAALLLHDELVFDELWVGADPPSDTSATTKNAVTALLGRAYDIVVLDLHDGLDADLVARAHGFVRGGGALVLRLSADDPSRLRRRFEAALGRADFGAFVLAPRRTFTGTPEQGEVVARIVQACSGTQDVVLIADRGRGKSAALGLAVAELTRRGLRVALAEDDGEPAIEVLRFAGPIERVPIDALRGGYDVIVVDEAARIGVPTLRRLVLANPGARFAFAATVHGYEGTGRGFALRFLRWLEATRLVLRLGLKTPIRWDPNDPLERFVFDALLLDAEPDDVTGVDLGAVVAVELDRDAVSEAELRAVFGLLVQAHYRTTPNDLARLLDAPNLDTIVLRVGGRVVAACLCAREGGLDPATIETMLLGKQRVAAHALADVLIAHLGHIEAGALSMLRSVRIAVHPDVARLGLATRLVEHVHARYAVDLFGTLFGATPELVGFRRALGYDVVRVSASHNARSGEPSLMMLRPVSERAFTLMAALRRELAHELPAQLALLGVEPEMAALLSQGLPHVAPRTDAECEAIVRRYATTACTFESVAAALTRWLEERDLGPLSVAERTVIQRRVREHATWPAAATAANLSVPAAMRLLRPAIRKLLD